LLAITALVPLWRSTGRTASSADPVDLQAASGAGAAGDGGLLHRPAQALPERAFSRRSAHPYAFNVFNHDTKIDPETGYNEEETR